jgi:hypothetical protein
MINNNILINVCMFFSLFVPISFGYTGGSGTPADPYQIANATDLIALGQTSTDYDKSFILTANIDLTGQTFSAAVIAPDTVHSSFPYNFDFQGTAFSGIFDGDSHTISNLTISDGGAGYDYLGLFGQIAGSSGAVKNLDLTDVDIAGSRYVAALCGQNFGSITDCLASGTVSGHIKVGGLCGDNQGTIVGSSAASTVAGGLFVGGLCGYNWDGTITFSYSSGNVTASRFVGGLCGYNEGSIQFCYATGVVTGYNYLIGGLCGVNADSVTTSHATGQVTGQDSTGGLCGWNKGTVADCYARGSVIGDTEVGGLCGASFNSAVTNSYSSGQVAGVQYYGGLCGWMDAGSFTACFWDTQTSAQPTSDGGTGNTTVQMQSQTTFTSVGWDFVDETANGTDDLWEMSASYPILIAFAPIEPNPSLSFEPIADTFTNRKNPTTNYGGRDEIDLRLPTNTYGRICYFKFDVNGLSGAPFSAILKLYSTVQVGQVDAYEYADTSWGETTFVWDEQSALGAVIGSTTAAADSWFEIDVSSYITGNDTYTIAVTTPINATGKVSSKEGTNPPALEITEFEAIDWCKAANLDGILPVSLPDFAILATDWLLAESSLSGDIDQDGSANEIDLGIMTTHWLSNCN